MCIYAFGMCSVQDICSDLKIIYSPASELYFCCDLLLVLPSSALLMDIVGWVILCEEGAQSVQWRLLSSNQQIKI